MFFITLALILLFTAIVVASSVSFVTSSSESIGIIGGADGPTAILVTRTILSESPVFWMLGFVVVLLITSVIGWIMTKKR